MPTDSPIWPAPLDHLRLDSDRPNRLADFYADLLGFDRFDLPDGSRLLQGPGRRLVIGAGKPGARPYHGFRLRDRAQLDAVRAFVAAKGINMEPSPSAVFDPDAVAVRDPDGWLSVFGLPRGDLPAIRTVNGVPGRSFSARLQHVVVASENLGGMMRWYEDVLGFARLRLCAGGHGRPRIAPGRLLPLRRGASQLRRVRRLRDQGRPPRL